MNFTAFRTVRARLLALMVLVILPIALLSAVTALTTYRSVLASIETAQRQTAGNFAVRTRIWYRETLRSLLATVAATRATERTAADCPTIVRSIVDGIGAPALLAIDMGGRPPCQANAEALGDIRLTDVLSRFRERPRTSLWMGEDLADTRYGHILIGTDNYLGVHIRLQGGPEAGGTEAVLLVAAVILDRGFDLGGLAPGVIVALVDQPGQIVIARGAAESDTSWLPGEERLAAAVQRWDGTSRNGARAAFASQIVAEPGLYVLARFDQSAERAAFVQFVALLLTPLITLAVLFAAYSHTIDSHVVRWIRGIEGAAMARVSQQPKLAPVDPSMPEDIRRVSEAFNALVSEQHERVERLNLTIGANRYLVRELHHRVKNSLQVVQSYLGIARRQNGEAHRAVLAAVEAKVQVLSIAYRHALAQGEMRPVEIAPFLEEIASSLNDLMHGGARCVITSAPDGISLVVDRAIPLGLLIVEVETHLLAQGASGRLDVVITTADEGHVELVVTTDSASSGATDTRIVHGLLRQLEATAVAATTEAEGAVGHWRLAL